MKPNTWKTEAIVALMELGGEGYYRDIFSIIKRRKVIDFSNAKTPAATLYYILGLNSNNVKFGASSVFFRIKDKKGYFGLVGYQPVNDVIPLTYDDEGFGEGALKLITHIRRERNASVVKEAKERFLKVNGQLICEICGDNMSLKYGEIGKNYVEVHHLVPVSQMKEGDLTRVEDLIMVCPNCHSMIHRHKPWITKEGLKDILIKV